MRIHYLVTFALAAAAIMHGAVPPVSFQASRQFAVPGNANGVATGDFNGDGKPDLAVVNIGNKGFGSVSVMLGKGDGNFQPPRTFSTGSTRSLFIATGDFDGDGKLDLAVGGANNDAISILLGRGDGTFRPAMVFSGGEGYLVVGDFNGDGKLDLAGADGEVFVMLGNGDGSFQPPVYDNLISGALSLAAIDFNGDGKLDLAVGDQSVIYILLGNGDGTFQPPTSYANGGQYIALGDLNGDGKIDIVTSSPGLSTLLGNGDGTFQPAVSLGNSCDFPVVADFNGDHHLDVACAAGEELLVLLGHGDGTFQPPIYYPSGGNPSSLAVADFNGDGVPDLAAPEQSNSGTVSILIGAGDGTFPQAPVYPVGSMPNSIAAADFNGDGKLDLAVANYNNGTGGGSVSILLGNGDGTFHPQITSSAVTTPYFVAAADLNGDGKSDLVVVNVNLKNGAGDILVLLGNGDGTFQRPVKYSVGAYPWAVAIADFTGDGKLDLAVASGTGVGKISILKGKGDGTFKLLATYPVGGYASAVVAADFNGDGKLDLAVGDSSRGAEGVWILQGNGDGTFKLPISRPTGSDSYRYALAAGMFGTTGKPDLVAATSSGVVILKNDGHGVLQFPVTLSRQYSTGLAIADFNGDGKPDVAAVHPEGGVGVILGKGNGAFAPEAGFVGDTSPIAIVTGDFNGDGKPDIAAANNGSNNVSILLNTTP